MANDRTQIALTGIGMVSAAGAGVSALHHALDSATTCIGPLRHEVARGLSVVRGGAFPADLFDDDRFDDDTAAVEAVCAMAIEEALQHAGWPATAREPTRVGLALGTALGGVEHLEQLAGATSTPDPKRLRRALPHHLTETLVQGAALRGPASTFSSTCSSSLYALEQACLDLQLGRADVMVCGGVDTLSRFMQAGFCALGALDGAARPTGEASGLLLGEAACFLVLEPLQHVTARGSRALAVVAGRGGRTDSIHLTSPDPTGTGMTRAIHDCLDDADARPDDVGWVSLTAAASPAYARMYHNVMQRVFGRHTVEFVGWEHCTGHVLAASGAFGIAHAAMVLATRTQSPNRSVLALTVGFGGQNGATLLNTPCDPRLVVDSPERMQRR